MAELSEAQYQVLLTFRCALRRFQYWSAEEAAKLGLTAQQHQLLLTVRAHPGASPPSISDLAEYLLIRPHSAVELANRAEAAGLVTRVVDEHDQRVVRVRLTEAGRRVIEQLSEAHMSELELVAERLNISQELLERLSMEFMQHLLHDEQEAPMPRG
jgi:DNA-binding MarR family transcriptional regulator